MDHMRLTLIGVISSVDSMEGYQVRSSVPDPVVQLCAALSSLLLQAAPLALITNYSVYFFEALKIKTIIKIRNRNN